MSHKWEWFPIKRFNKGYWKCRNCGMVVNNNGRKNGTWKIFGKCMGCKHIWVKDSFTGKDIFGRTKTINWQVCNKCGVIRKIKFNKQNL